MNRPLPPGPLEHDEDGDPLPQPAAASDLADLIQLLEYARTKQFRIGPMIRIGKIALQVRDLRQDKQLGAAEKQDAPPEPDIWDMTMPPEQAE